MLARALSKNEMNSLNETELFAKLQMEMVERYQIEPGLASEMAWDLLEVLSAVDGNFDILEKYFLH